MSGKRSINTLENWKAWQSYENVRKLIRHAIIRKERTADYRMRIPANL